MPDRVRRARGKQDEEPLANTLAGVEELNLLAAPGSRRGNGPHGHNKGTNLQSAGADVLNGLDVFGPTSSVHWEEPQELEWGQRLTSPRGDPLSLETLPELLTAHSLFLCRSFSLSLYI